MVRPFVLSIACGSVLAFVLQRSEPARDMRLERSGTASLAGIVTDMAQPARPLRNATVTLNSDAFIGPRLATTDDNGRFEFSRLPAAEYRLAAAKPAYLPVNYGATKPRRTGMSVPLTDGQRVSNLRIAIPRGAVITGRVRNAAGEPIAGIAVTAMHWRFYNGERRLVNFAAPPARTDSRGEYRLYSLEAGDYLVVAEPSPDARGIQDVVALTDADVTRALTEARQPAIASAVPPSRPGIVGLAPVFHPGTADGAAATTVTLASGEERSGIDIRMQLVPMARLSGVVTRQDRRDVSGVQVLLTSMGPPAPTGEFAGTGGWTSPRTPDAEGRFSFAAVPPGEYRLMATTRPRSQFTGRGGGGRSGAPSAPPTPEDPHPLVAFAMLNVNGEDQTLSLAFQPAMTIAGRVVFEGASPPNPAGTRVSLEDLRIDPSGALFRSTADAAPDGSFRVNYLWPGNFLVRVTPPAGTPADWALKSLISNGRELLDARFELQPYESLTDVVATFTDRPSELTGTLQVPISTAASGYFIVVFAANQSFWFPNSRRIVSVRPNTSGIYTIRNLPAGEYFVSAVTDVEDGEWFDPEFLNALRAAAPMRISLSDGEKKRQDLAIHR